MAAAKFRLALLDISKKLGPNEIEYIKYVYEGTIPKGKLENINSGIALMRSLEEHGIITVNEDIDEIKKLIFHEILQVPTEQDNQAVDELKRLNYIYETFFDYVSERIATVFEKLGRYLYVSDQQIELIKTDNVTYPGIKRKAFEVLKLAHQSRPEGLKWKDLREGLIHCKRWDVIREIEANSKFNNIVHN